MEKPTVEMLECDCGESVSRKGLSAHIKSNRHLAKVSKSSSNENNRVLGELMRSMIQDIVKIELDSKEP